ncbi:MAG: KEOPS complex subunit Pcc1 [Nitrososphaeria archaeon]
MMRKTKLSLTLESEDKKMISTVFKALSPDNVNIPKDLSFRFSIVNGKIVLTVSSERNLETLISTVREVLDNIGLCIQAIMVKENGEN